MDLCILNPSFTFLPSFKQQQQQQTQNHFHLYGFNDYLMCWISSSIQKPWNYFSPTKRKQCVIYDSSVIHPKKNSNLTRLYYKFKYFVSLTSRVLLFCWSLWGLHTLIFMKSVKKLKIEELGSLKSKIITDSNYEHYSNHGTNHHAEIEVGYIQKIQFYIFSQYILANIFLACIVLLSHLPLPCRIYN